MSDALVEAIADMRDEEAIELARRLLDSGTAPLEILGDCRKAMAIVGQRFEDEEYFIPELILAGEMLRAVEAERLFADLKRTRDEKERFYEAIERLNRTTKPVEVFDATLEVVDYMYGEQWPRGLTLYALILHQTHHRAQMTVLMRQAGLVVPGVYGPNREETEKMGKG